VGPADAAAGAQGWFYEDLAVARPGSDLPTTCTEPGQEQRISVTITPVIGSEIRLECLQTVQAGSAGAVSVGSICAPASDPCGAGLAPDHVTPLSCDAASRTCGLPCTSDATCTQAGLLGRLCDPRTWEEAVGADVAPPAERDRLLGDLQAAGVDPAAPHAFCISPTCL